jgi:hypothetical protein
MSYRFLDGSPVSPELEIHHQDGSNKPMVFADHKWHTVRWNGTAPAPRSNGLAKVVSRRASTVRPERASWSWEGRWPLHAVSLIVGVPGVNKSTVATDRAARITRGQLEGDLKGTPCPVLILSAEDSPANTIVPRLMAAGADLDLVYLLTIEREGFEGDLILPGDLEVLEGVIRELEIALVILDPFVAHLGADVNSHKDQDVRRALGPLAHVADRTGCAIVAVVHLNKAVSLDLFTKVSGSVGISAAARSILVVARDPDDEDGEQGYGRVLVHAKSNLSPYAPSLRFRAEQNQFDLDGDTITTVSVVWLGVAEGVGPSDVLGTAPIRRDAPQLEGARTFLMEQLATGAVAVSALQFAAKGKGISWTTVKRAKQDIGVVAFRHGESGRLGGGEWRWRLPVDLRGPSPNTNKVVPLKSPGENGDLIKETSSSVSGDHLEPLDQQVRFGASSTCSVCGENLTYAYVNDEPICPRCRRDGAG